MHIKKLALIFCSIFFFVNPDGAKSQDLIINKNMDSIHCKILAVKGEYYYYKTFIDLSSQIKIMNVSEIWDTVRNYYSYPYNKDSALIVNRYYYLKNSKRALINAHKISLNYGFAAVPDYPSTIPLFRTMFQSLGMPYMNHYFGLSYSKIFYRNFGVITSITNIRSDKNSNINSYTGSVTKIIPISMELNNWNYNLGLTYISTQKRYPKFSWQFSSELGYYRFQSLVNYIVNYDIQSNALSWKNSASIEYSVFKNLTIGLCGFAQLSKNKLYNFSTSSSNFDKENPDERYNSHIYVGTSFCINYLLSTNKK